MVYNTNNNFNGKFWKLLKKFKKICLRRINKSFSLREILASNGKDKEILWLLWTFIWKIGCSILISVPNQENNENKWSLWNFI